MNKVYCPHCNCKIPEKTMRYWWLKDGEYFNYACKKCNKRVKIRVNISINYTAEQFDCSGDTHNYVKLYLGSHKNWLWDIGIAECIYCEKRVVFDKELNKEAWRLYQELTIKNPLNNEIKELLERNEISFQNWLKTKKED